MNYRDVTLLDRLAAEYVLGTLRGLARKRFERILNADFRAQTRVRFWQEKLTPLAYAVKPIDTSPRVWSGIESRLFGAAQVTTVPAAPTRSTDFWRRVSVFFGTLTTALGIAFGVVASAGDPQCYAVLTDPQSQPVAVVFDQRDMRELRVLPIGSGLMRPGKQPVLWTVASGKVHGVGVLKGDVQTRLMLSPESLSALMQPGVKLAISAEPPGEVAAAPKGEILVDGMLAMMPARK
jgi:anti-sigma-K factor RskA